MIVNKSSQSKEKRKKRKSDSYFILILDREFIRLFKTKKKAYDIENKLHINQKFQKKHDIKPRITGYFLHLHSLEKKKFPAAGNG